MGRLVPPKAMKNGFCSATTLPGSTALPFVISTGAPKERSGEICGQRSFLGNVFRESAAICGSADRPENQRATRCLEVEGLVESQDCQSRRDGTTCSPAR
jgi:hypothetical protein